MHLSTTSTATAPAPATAYEHRYLRAVAQHHPARSATGALAWHDGAGRLLDEFAAAQLRSLQLEGLIRFDGHAVTLTDRGNRRLAFWDELAQREQPAPTGQLALL